MEIDSQESPLALDCVADGLDGRDVEGDERGCRVRDQNCRSFYVDVDLTLN